MFFALRSCEQLEAPVISMEQAAAHCLSYPSVYARIIFTTSGCLAIWTFEIPGYFPVFPKKIPGSKGTQKLATLSYTGKSEGVH